MWFSAMSLAALDPYRNMAGSQSGSQAHARLARLLEQRAGESQQQALRDGALAEALRGADLAAVEAVEVGCGTGPLCRTLAAHASVASVLGVDPCVTFIVEAQRLSAGNPK